MRGSTRVEVPVGLRLRPESHGAKGRSEGLLIPRRSDAACRLLETRRRHLLRKSRCAEVVQERQGSIQRLLDGQDGLLRRLSGMESMLLGDQRMLLGGWRPWDARRGR